MCAFSDGTGRRAACKAAQVRGDPLPEGKVATTVPEALAYATARGTGDKPSFNPGLTPTPTLASVLIQLEAMAIPSRLPRHECVRRHVGTLRFDDRDKRSLCKTHNTIFV